MSSDDLATPAGAARVLRAFGIRPRKRWGQHFLVSRRALDQILAAADLTDQDTVLEIGAGLGTLTAALAQRAGRVIAVEIDRALLPALQAAVGSCHNVQTIIGDAMTIDPAAAFSQRRKTVRNALAGGFPMPASDAEAACLQAGVAPGRRGETMHLPEFAALADAVAKMVEQRNAGEAQEGVS